MAVKDKYASVLALGERLGVRNGKVEEGADGVLRMWGTVNNGYEKDQLWDAIKAISGANPTDIVVDVQVDNPSFYTKHTVAKGETLGSIVKKYDANLEEVLGYNDLASVDAIVVGDELLIPGGELHTPKYVAAANPTKTSGVKSTVGFIHPAPGAIKTQGIHGYNGVDLAAAYGTTIKAAAAGSMLCFLPLQAIEIQSGIWLS